MALLDRVDHNAHLLGPGEDLSSVLHLSEMDPQAPSRQNYLLTGLLIICIGVGCVLFGRALRVGEIAVGTYLGGVFCFILGFVVVGLGAIIRLASRNPISRLHTKPPSSNS